ncbi:Glycosyl transferase family 2 [Poseidonocella pacifica]|uniref:Glycosyl transferase family 2 n=1 Tax=Poseidonocella pacifica TaxID=871651 RepID=A0A1I0V8L0_9RHOB|nr:glycosyltransferase [Poseidonocella pacifica]SFA71906.1 Glycosyl transferase family 2 [Poseidonocella pacifica]
MTDGPLHQPHVTIALCTYNGGAHLQFQLESFLHQHHKNWSLWISDDGSTDETLDTLQRFAQAHGEARDIRIVNGPRRGLAANYLSLLRRYDLPSGLVALSDQDDIWLRGKLTRAVRRITMECANRPESPILYGAQSFHVDNELRVIGKSSTARACPDFCNALVQNVVSGHSAVLNEAAVALVRKARDPGCLPFHDWWLYQLITAAGGTAVIDERPVLLYRQHPSATMGSHDGWRARLDRIRMVLGKTYGDWIAANLEELTRNADLLEPKANELVSTMIQGTPSWGLGRAAMLRRLGLHRQTRLGTGALMLAGFLGRV